MPTGCLYSQRVMCLIVRVAVAVLIDFRVKATSAPAAGPLINADRRLALSKLNG
jgi:hypothetical protein